MEPDLFRFDDPPVYERKRTNYFGWTILILLLCGLVLAAWLGSFYIIGQPERPESYRLLQKLHKIEPPKRFALTAAPAGEFLNPKELFDIYSAMGPAQLARKDAELTRNFIRNYERTPNPATYVVGRFNIMGARQLTHDDLITTGAVALTRAMEKPELLMEHVFTTANDHDARLLVERLVMGMDINLERSHDLSVVVHAAHLPDGRVQITAVPLLYGSYTMTRGTGTFSLEPPASLNLAAGWPLFKTDRRRMVETRYDTYRSRLAPSTSTLPILGLASAITAPPAQDALVRVEAAVPIEPESSPASATRSSKSTAAARSTEDETRLASSSPTRIRRAVPVTDGSDNSATEPASPTPLVLRAQPVGSASPAVALTSTTGATWKTFAPGEAPAGRVLDTAGLREVADSGTRGERYYLKGQFVVNFADANRAVLRPTGAPSRGLGHNVRVIVDYPAGVRLPEPGSTLDRDITRPYEITEVRRQSDGQLNVFVREIIQQ